MNASVSVSPHTFVSQDEWLAARRDLPWMKLTKGYVFDTPKGKVRSSP